jgi:hypothetical protein
MKISIFWYITPYIPTKVSRRFGESCRLNLEGRTISKARKNDHESDNKQSSGGDKFLPKRPLTFNGLQAVIIVYFGRMLSLYFEGKRDPDD